MRWRTRGLFVLASLVFFCGQGEARACEPILPLFKALAGANFVSSSLLGLAAAVLIKCVAFACYEKSLSWPKAFCFMLAGNIVTSLIGIVIAGFAAAPALLISLPLLFMATFWAARQLLPRVAWPWIQKLSPEHLAGFVVLALFVSYLLFGLATTQPDPPRLAYWIFKSGGLYAALLISMVITTFYEEWMVYVLARKPKEPPSFYTAVVRANLLTLFVIMGCTAAYMLPQRFASPFFTILPK
jgi:hypothetical protein